MGWRVGGLGLDGRFKVLLVVVSGGADFFLK
jgi:hypothetical protein